MITLTYNQYWTTAFLLFEFATFYTMKSIFSFPDEVENGSYSDY